MAKAHRIVPELSNTQIIRFWAKVRVKSPTDCWPWDASLNSNGYGRFRVHPHNFIASRVAYRISHGSIPRGMEICHSCDNPKCCNPNHFFLGTHRDNIRDAVAKGRMTHVGPKGMDSCRAKLSDQQVNEIRRRLSDGHRQRDIARSFGIGKTTVAHIYHRRTWGHLSSPSSPN